MSSRPWFVRFVRHLSFAGLLASCASARLALAEEPPLTRARVAELLRVAPASRVSDAETRVAAAAVDAGAAIALEEPVLSALGGARLGPAGERSLSAVVTLAVPLELGGQASAQGEVARAELRAAGVQRDAEGRRALLGALLQHARVLRDERQLALARERRALAARLVAAADKRRKAGSVGALDVTLASLQDRRDASFEAAAAGERDAQRLELWARLGLSPVGEVPVTGELVPPAEPPPLAALVADADGRVDVRAAEAQVESARARAAEERAAGWPALSLLAQYERDGDADIGLAGLAIPLPVFHGNRAAIARSSAAVDVATAQLELARQSAAGGVRALWSRYQSTKAVWDALVPTGTLAEEAVSLATRSYELGEGDLASVLLARREAIEAQMALLEAEHAHASAKIELLVVAGRSVP